MMDAPEQDLYTRIARICAGLCLLAFVCLAAGSSAAGDVSGIRGVVTDAAGKPLAEVGVEATDASGAAVQGGFVLTGRDGGYVLRLPAGTYGLKVTAPGFGTQTFRGLQVRDGTFTEKPVQLSGSTVQIEEMRVVAKPRQSSDFTQMMKRQASAGIMDNIAADTIKKIPESDVAGILTRMPGVVMDQGKYMQARGMTKRYNNTLLNGSIVPTTRPNEKLTPLDLFPGGVVDSISVAKTFTPDLPANFSGGLCQIRTKALPDSLQLKLSYTAKYNTETTGEDYLSYSGGGRDWAGYDDGTRKLPHSIPGNTIRPGGLFTKGLNDREIEKLGESFNNIWNIKRRRAHIQSDYEFVAGNRFGKFGLVMATYYKSDVKNYVDETKTIFTANSDGSVRPDSTYDFQQSRRSIKEGGLFNFGIDFSPDHKLFFTNFYNRNTTDEARVYEGFNSDQATDIRVSRLRYIQEEFYSGGIAGDHTFDGLWNSRIKWRYNFSLARLDDPDMRQSTYEFSEAEQTFLLSNDTEALLRMFTKQDEDMDDLAFDWSFEPPSPWQWLSPKVQFGAAYTKRNRDFWSRRFAFRQRDMSGLDLSQDPETLLDPHNINQREFYLDETTRATDTYTAEERLAAGYVMVDLTFFDKVQLLGGVRLERDKTNVVTKNLFNPDEQITTKLNDNTWHPSINLKYSPVKDMNFRLGFSRTVSRPEFHELAPFEFTDVIGGSSLKGNPDLQVAKIKNYDFRWEWFINRQDILAVSLFYKDITNAIEPTIQPTVQLRSSYTNAEDAWLKGVEFELRKNLGFVWSGLRHWSVTGNYVYAESETTVEPKPGFVPTSSKRALVGQPENMVNCALEYDNPDWGFTARFMYQYTDERVHEIGGLGLPDIVEKEHDRFDLVLIKNFGKHWSVKFTAQNLNNEPYTLLQGGQVHHTYKVGRTFKLGVSWKW